MKSPKDMSKIQIDITNACGNMCSNCTRFCGHHVKTFFMDFDTFTQAVDSLDGYEGMVGVIGGEPTLHPEFERFADYIREKRVKERIYHAQTPIADMQQYILNEMWHEDAKAGLWSSLSSGYYKYFETINDTFKTQLLNDHNNKCMHQALLMSRKELGIDDKEWIEKREACWIQNTWSATITPKGAFFCEVAGALDMLFQGPGGWKIEKDWWKREPKDFGDQLHWCEMCSACLDVPQRVSNDGRDDVTPKIYEKLIELNSPKAKKGMCVIHKREDYDKTKYHTFTGDNDYMDLGNNQRTTLNNRNLYPKSFKVTNWKGLSETIKEDCEDWVLVADDLEKAKKQEKKLANLIINPGCLYYYQDVVAFNVKARSIRDKMDLIIGNNPRIWENYPLDKIIRIESFDDICLMDRLGKIKDQSRLAVYGAGRRGRELVSWLIENGKTQNLKSWVDMRFQEIGYPVNDPNSLDNNEIDEILVAIESEKIYLEVREYLLDLGITKEKVVWIPYIVKRADI